MNKPLRLFEPFPIDQLPAPLSAFVGETSQAIGCDSSMIVLPLLAALASAIGNSRVLRLNATWTEPASIWSMVISESGTRKSPALEAVLAPIREAQKEEMRKHDNRLTYYRRAELGKKRQRKEFFAGKSQETPRASRAPIARRFLASDVTLPALGRLLADNPRGIFVVRDELAALFHSLTDGDTARWCEMFGATELLLDRGVGKSGLIHVPRACVSVSGTTQPGIIARALTQNFHDSGLVARFLIAAPPRVRKQWGGTGGQSCTQSNLMELFQGLYALTPDKGNRKEWTPREVTMNPKAESIWAKFYERHDELQSQSFGHLAAAYSKLEGYTARIALVIHCVRVVNGDVAPKNVGMVDGKSMSMAVAIQGWLVRETERVYAMLAESDAERTLRSHDQLIRQFGGPVTVRNWQRTRGLNSSAEAKAELDCLVEAGRGAFDPPKKGKRGRPSPTFRLHE